MSIHRTALVIAVLGLSLVVCFLIGLEPKAASGKFDGNSPPDTSWVRHYLQRYRGNLDHDSAGIELRRMVGSADPERLLPVLAHLTASHSVDYASSILTDLLRSDPVNRRADSLFRALLERPLAEGRAEFQDSFVVLFVPGWVYRSNPESGADFARQRALLTEMKIDHHLLQISESGTIEENGAFVAGEIRRRRADAKRIILVSASSGGASVLHALGVLLSVEETAQVAAWVNIGGLLKGSALADFAVLEPDCFFTRLIVWLRGWRYESIESMVTAVSRERFNRAHLPQGVFYLNYIGIPLSGRVTDRARDGYERLRMFGPNDGLTLITDALIPGAPTIVEPDRDHFFVDDDIDLKTVALLEIVDEVLSGRPAPQ